MKQHCVLSTASSLSNFFFVTRMRHIVPQSHLSTFFLVLKLRTLETKQAVSVGHVQTMCALPTTPSKICGD